MPRREFTHLSADISIEAIRKSGGRLNDFAIVEMHDYLRRIGYVPSDLNKLNVVHITGTKGKGSTSAFTERLLRTHIKGKIGKSINDRANQVYIHLHTSALFEKEYESMASHYQRKSLQSTSSKFGRD